MKKPGGGYQPATGILLNRRNSVGKIMLKTKKLIQTTQENETSLLVSELNITGTYLKPKMFHYEIFSLIILYL